MEDPYKVLSAQRGASAETIRTAYCKLAKKHHPDLNPGKPQAAEKFKEINAAHDILGDEEKRARSDRGEIDAAGDERATEPPRYYRDFGDAGGATRYGGNISPEDLEELFGDAFSGFGSFRAGREAPRQDATSNTS